MAKGDDGKQREQQANDGQHEHDEAPAVDQHEQTVPNAEKAAADGAAGDAAARRMAHGGKKSKPDDKAASFVEKGDHLERSDADQTVVGLRVGGGWMVAVSHGKPVGLDGAVVGSLRGSRHASVIQMQAAANGGGAWKLDGQAAAMLVEGDGAAARVLGEIAKGTSSGRHPHGMHGSKDKLPTELAALIKENDLLTLDDRAYAWLSYPTGSGADNPAGWATTSHSKKQVDNLVTQFKADAEKLPEPLRTEVLQNVEAIAVVSAVEGNYDATSGQVADTSGSLGIFQWARSRDSKGGADSLDKFFARMAKRAASAQEKAKKGEQPTADELAAVEAWDQAQKMGIGVKDGKTTITQGGKTKAAGGLDLELAAAGSAGLQDSYQVTQALRASRYADKSLEKMRKNKPKTQSATDEKKAEVAFLDGVIAQLAAAFRDVLASDLVNSGNKPSLEKQLEALEKKDEHAEAKEEAEESDPDKKKAADAARLAALDSTIKDKAQRVKAADPVLRKIIDAKIQKAPLMTSDAMKQYQLVAALDWIKEFQASAVVPSYAPYRATVLPHTSIDSGSATVSRDGHELHLASGGGSTVGDHLKSEKALAEVAMLGVNRPAYVATALWAALQNGEPAKQVDERLKTIFGTVDKLQSAGDGKDKKHAKGKLNESALKALLGSAGAENKADAEAAGKALDELKGILWPVAGKEDEGALITRYRAEAMRIYNTVEATDAGDNNRVGRFVTVELVDWNAVEAAKAKQ